MLIVTELYWKFFISWVIIFWSLNLHLIIFLSVCLSFIAKRHCKSEKSIDLTTLTAHRKTRSYLHRFKVIEPAGCPCANGNQTVDHLLYDCSKLNNEREHLAAHISKEDNWPIRKSELVNKYLKQVIHFTNSIDYEKM